MPAELQIWLMRHAEAEDPDQASRDELRALTERGRRQVAVLGRWLAERTEAPELVLHSPLKRARETAEILAAEISGNIPVQVSDTLAPGMRASALIDALRNNGMSRIVCVGHQPDIGECLSAWINGGQLNIAPGTLAIVTFHGSPTLGRGILRGMLNPAWFLDR